MTNVFGNSAPLPADAVLVHVGPYKTGTTAIQSTLARSRDLLREHGATYPGELVGHHREAMALRRFRDGWEHDSEAPPDPTVWARLSQRVRETPGRVVLSSELLADADDVARAKLVDDLGSARLHLVAAARNPAAMAVSAWQQILRKGYPVTLDEWLREHFCRTEVPAEPSGFWAYADTGTVVSRWAKVLHPDRITVVVLDERDRRLLPATFERLLGLPDGLLADQEAPDPNRSLSAVEAAFVKKIIELCGERLTWADYRRVMRDGVIRRLLHVRRPGPEEPKVQFPTWAVEKAIIEAERSIVGLRESGARLVGDLAALRTMPAAAAPSPPITQIPLEVAAQAVAGAVAAA